MPLNSPIASVIVANRNGERFLSDALTSALKQTLRDLEVIIIDDSSSDASLAIAHDFAARDKRVQVVSRQGQSGPGSARNEGLARATGRWIAILDSDDMMHPLRLEQLIAEAELAHADICADDLLVFQEGGTPTSLLSARQRKLGWVSASAFVVSNALLAKEPALGYLKPVIRRQFLCDHNISYATDLMIGEDYDLVVRLLAKGAKFRLVDNLGYFYRKHSQSISHRMSQHNITQMLDADTKLRKLFEPADHAVSRAFDARKASIDRAHAYSEIIAALKARKWQEAGTLALQKPAAIPLLAMPITARLRRLFQPRSQNSATAGRQVCLISRQRLIGPTNGSSTYLLSLCKALRDDGHTITLVSPSAATFGRLPFLRLRPEMDVFDRIHVRSAWRIGKRLWIAKDPRIAISAAAAIIARLAARAGITLASWDKPAPYAIAEPWQRNDLLFVARHAPPRSHLVVADYAFATPAIAYALSPSAASAVVMHDSFSRRADLFRQQKLADSVVSLDHASEMKLLGLADAVIAIQKIEAADVQAALPDRQVIVAPMACTVTSAPQPGDRRTVLFIGSNTAPNIIGLQWFLDAAWPHVTKALADCRLLVAGGVAAGFPNDVAGVQFLGMVPDLEDLYREAGVVISPLTVGSGLKIKLIEALAHGKAVVATRVTTEGCDDSVIEAIFERDDPLAFAEAIVQLLSDDSLRGAKAAQALAIAKTHYSPEGCYRDFRRFAETAATASQDAHKPGSAAATVLADGPSQ